MKFPGKLFLMGEYAVMEPGFPSVVMAVDKTIITEIYAADEFTIVSQYGQLSGKTLLTDTEGMRYVSTALRTVNRFYPLQEPFHLTIESELESVNHQKYGFGSSGVVIVAVIASILDFYQISISKIELFKMAVLAQLEMHELSSGGDLAAAVFGGLIIYERYDVQWLKTHQSSSEILHLEWPLLKIEPLQDDNFKIHVGWTQSVNRTVSYLKTYYRRADEDPLTYRALLLGSKSCVDTFINAWQENSYEGIRSSMHHYRKWMQAVASWTQLDIETVALTALIEKAEILNLGAKISGSGGGDCGIAIYESHNYEKIIKLDMEWKKNDIVSLDVEVFRHYE
ncbi:phosphomevalonate kinase [Erysipelothrix aquatica]|uniref:phosphomevalonate kinase n=1 Tax=Erysipelothrix aquatica TaxID=2683714 RepID=UPI001359BB25|nr:phosphomevalonate kinase [Erysipelothrix aquatica]